MHSATSVIRTRRGPRRFVAVIVAFVVVGVAGCSGNGQSADGADTTTTTTEALVGTSEATTTSTLPVEPALRDITPPTTEPDPDTTTTVGDGDVPPTTVPPGPPPKVYELDWSALTITPFFTYDDETNPDDPFWHLHNDPADGFLFALEMYTTGFGQAWAGEGGEFELACNDASSGICVQLDPDTTEEEPGNLNADFLAVGTIRIDRLDEGGYDLTISDLVFTDGSSLPGPTRLRGEVSGAGGDAES